MQIVIDSDVPVPTSRIGRRKGSFFDAVEKMDVGDSFAFNRKHEASVRGECVRCTKRTGRKFTVRKIDADTHRVWRIA